MSVNIGGFDASGLISRTEFARHYVLLLHISSAGKVCVWFIRFDGNSFLRI